jgi:glycosyltransferase involved in cell wall biosynthesis
VFAPLHRNNYLKKIPATLVDGRFLPSFPNRGYKLLMGYSVLKGRSKISGWKPDLVHETYYSRWRSGPSSVPSVVTVYDMIHELFPKDFSPRDKTSYVKRKAIERADHVICISESTRRDLLSLLDVAESKVSTVHLGFERFSSGPDSNELSTAKPYILYVGARGVYKNFFGLLKAVASSSRLRQDFDVIAFGGGAFSDSELADISGLGFNDGQVMQVGGDDFVLGTLYKQARAFVYPSLYEGFGLPPLEAMAQSCPVISSNTSSMPEVVGNAAVFFDPAITEDMKSAIERVVYDDELCAVLARAGHRRLDDFSWQQCAQKTASIYQSLKR